MKLLFVSSRAHLEGVGGGVTYARNMMALLQGIEGIVLETFPIDEPWAQAPRALRQLRAVIRSLLGGYPSKSEFLLAREAQQAFARRIARGDVDAVIFNGADLLPLGNAIPIAAKRILLTHNVENDIIRDQVAKLPGAMRPFMARDVARTHEAEVAGARSVDLIIAISARDAGWYAMVAPDVPLLQITAAFPPDDREIARPDVQLPLHAAFLAKMSWWPNREGAEWLLRDVLPALPQGRIEVEFAGPGSESLAGRSPGLVATGFVEDLDALWERSHFALCPILGGSGINIKLVEALHRGVPVLTTPHGLRGLPPIQDDALAVIEPDKWAEFLSGERVLALAQVRPSEDTRAQFSAAYHRETLRRALADL